MCVYELLEARDKNWVSDPIAHHILFQDRVSHWTRNSPIQLDCLTSKLWYAIYLHPSSARIIDMSLLLSFHVGAEDPNSGPIAFAASTLPMELLTSPKMPDFF